MKTLTVAQIKELLNKHGVYQFLSMPGYDNHFLIHEIFYELVKREIISPEEEPKMGKMGDEYYQKVEEFLGTLADDEILFRSKEAEIEKAEKDFVSRLTPALRSVWE